MPTPADQLRHSANPGVAGAKPCRLDGVYNRLLRHSQAAVGVDNIAELEHAAQSVAKPNQPNDLHNSIVTPIAPQSAGTPDCNANQVYAPTGQLANAQVHGLGGQLGQVGNCAVPLGQQAEVGQQPLASRAGSSSISPAANVIDLLGAYLVNYEDFPVYEKKDRRSMVIAQLSMGTTMHVLEIASEPVDGRIRARIESPAGWVTKSTADGLQHFMVKQATGSHLTPTSPTAGMAGMDTIGHGVNELLGETLSGESATKQFQELLKKRHLLKEVVAKAFHSVAVGKSTLDINGLRVFTSTLQHLLGFPGAIFVDLETQYERFDFGGDGQLDINECYKLAFFQLMQYWQQSLNGRAVSLPDVPVKSVQQAGYNITKVLGYGSQGVARLATNAQGREVCIKSIQKDVMQPGALVELQEEFLSMKRLACNRVLRVEEIFQDHECYYMVADVLHGGDLCSLKRRALEQRINPMCGLYKTVFRQCLDALAYLHSNALMHCDIKEPNIMLKTPDMNSPDVVLIDFGVSKALMTNDATPCGTPGYIPPETYRTGKWYPKGDVFSLGVVIVQLILENVPEFDAPVVFPATRKGIFLNGCSTLQEIANATFIREPALHLLQELSGLDSLVRGMLEKSVENRLRAPQALQHSWFSGASTHTPVCAADALAVSPLKSATSFAADNSPQNLHLQGAASFSVSYVPAVM
jgi:serine/threonine protein kinase